MGTANSREKKRAQKPRRYLVVCGHPVCAGDAFVAKKSELTETINDLMERRKSALQSYLDSQRERNSPVLNDDSDDGDEDDTSDNDDGQQMHRIDNAGDEKSSEGECEVSEVNTTVTPLHPSGWVASPSGGAGNGEDDAEGEEENDNSIGATIARRASDSLQVDYYGLENGDIFITESTSTSTTCTTTTTSSGSSISSESSEHAEHEPVFDKWNRPIYMPLNAAERCVVREARRQRSFRNANSQAGQMAKRGGVKALKPAVVDLSPERTVASRTPGKTKRRKPDETDSDSAPQLQRRSHSAVRFTTAVVVGTASTVKGGPDVVEPA